MTIVRFLPVDFVLRDHALLPAGRGVSPVTEPYISGPVVRGVLAELCGGDNDLLDLVIRSGTVAAAPAFPLLDQHTVAHPAPLPLVVGEEDDYGDTPAYDERDLADLSGVKLTRPGGLVSTDGGQWVRADVRTRTHLRLIRDRTRTASEGVFGPVVFTTLAPNQAFRSHLRIEAADDSALTAVAETVTRLFDKCFRLGSGADGSYGGEVATEVGRPVDDAEATGAGIGAGGHLDLVLRSPALVRDPGTGEHTPDALGQAVAALVNNIAGETVRDPVASVARHRWGGAHAGYGRARPEHWAAAAGSVVRLTLPGGLSAENIKTILRGRVGEHTVDGLGILGRLATAPMIEATPTSLHAPTCGNAVPLPFGAPAAARAVDNTFPAGVGQVDWLQRAMLTQATEAFRTREAARLAAVIVKHSGELPTPTLLATVREHVSDTPAVADLVAKVRDVLGDTESKRGASARTIHEAMNRLRFGTEKNVNVWTWLAALAAEDGGSKADRFPPGTEDRWRKALAKVVIPQGTGSRDPVVAAGVAAHAEALSLTLAREVLGLLRASSQAQQDTDQEVGNAR